MSFISFDFQPTVVRAAAAGPLYADESAPSNQVLDPAAEVATVETASATVAHSPRPLDGVKPSRPANFPNPPKEGQRPATTLANLHYVMDAIGITIRYDVIKKRTRITVPGHTGTSDNFDSVAMSYVLSLAALNGMNIGSIPNFVLALGDQNPFNPVADWIASKTWDGKDRLPDFYATLQERADFPVGLKETIMRRWLLSAVAAALTDVGFRSRGVLTLQGAQGIGKTAWVRALISDSLLSRQVIKVDHHMDGTKDSQISAVEHFIVELGELEGSLRKDIAKLKGFLTADQDKIRRPYALVDSEYQRRTVFCATVNDENFLVDSTGNTRFWTIPLIAIDASHGIDMQQLFGQLAEQWRAGEQHWLTEEEEAWLEQMNKGHQTVSAIRERLLDQLDQERIGADGVKAMTPTEILKAIGIDNPTNPQAKECGAVLREILGDSKKINGRDRWRFPFQQTCDGLSRDNLASAKVIDDDDLY